MAGLSLRVGVTGDLSGFSDRMHKLVGFDFTGLFQALGNAVLNDTLDAFKSGESPFGEEWPESGRVTRGNAARARRGKKGRTLVDTARLRNSLHVEADAEAAEVGTDVVYACIHQFGGETGRGHKTKLPARPYLPVDKDGNMAPKTRERLGAVTREHIAEKLK